MLMVMFQNHIDEYFDAQNFYLRMKDAINNMSIILMVLIFYMHMVFMKTCFEAEKSHTYDSLK